MGRIPIQGREKHLGVITVAVVVVIVIIFFVIFSFYLNSSKTKTKKKKKKKLRQERREKEVRDPFPSPIKIRRNKSSCHTWLWIISIEIYSYVSYRDEMFRSSEAPKGLVLYISLLACRSRLVDRLTSFSIFACLLVDRPESFTILSLGSIAGSMIDSAGVQKLFDFVSVVRR